MNKKLLKLIAESYGAAEAEVVLRFQPSQFSVQQLADAGNEILARFPYRSGACALMTAMWVALIRDNTDHPIHAVAGSLFIDDHHVFGSNSTANQIKGIFTGTNLDWDGHCWIVLGNLIGDVSIFRTAYSDTSPPVLKEKILSEFGEGRGLFIEPGNSTEDAGIRYEPKYVLTNDEITGLFRGAVSMINKLTGT